ncbi:hypothetical protein [Streptomyces sp. NPDC048385]|uniref:hypothetical protein n=1 Tax=unclassified Streptomyces TaxID=2593676 RepID=UPI00342F4116
MLALRLTLPARPAVHLRRLLVAAAAAGTGFLLLSALGYGLTHPAHSTAALLRLSWCAVPLAATVHLAVAVARTDPGAKPRSGLSAFGLGPARLMAVAALNTAVACALGSLLALLFFLHLRGDPTGMPFGGAAKDFLAVHRSLPLPAALTLLTVPPVLASGAVALALRPRDVPAPAARPHTPGRFGTLARKRTTESFGAYGRFGARLFTRPPQPTRAPAENGTQPPLHPVRGAQPSLHPAGSRAAGAAGVPPREGSRAWGPGGAGDTPSGAGTPQAPVSESHPAPADLADDTPAPLPDFPDLPTAPPPGLPWGIAVLAAGLAAESYAGLDETAPHTTLPGGLAGGPAGVLAGWALTALGVILAAPGLTHLCGRLLQAVRPGARRLLAGRVLMAEATRVGRPLGVVGAVASAGFAATTVYGYGGTAGFGPLTALGVLVVAGCTVATLLIAAAEARQFRAETTAALLRLGAPAAMLRAAAALRAGTLLIFFGALTLLIAELAALPLAR